MIYLPAGQINHFFIQLAHSSLKETDFKSEVLLLPKGHNVKCFDIFRVVLLEVMIVIKLSHYCSYSYGASLYLARIVYHLSRIVTL